MITVTPEAAAQIKAAAKQSQAEGLPLRMAATQAPDGNIQYGMGFADDETENDLTFKSEGVTIVVAPTSFELLKNTIIDYVQLDSGEMNFIFRNPNDPNFKQVQ
ncbi:MAG: iron-sulfur cluster assembly accessory protein [Gammaproteobacteria bacterium]|nr:iron-sulfur cluster assembly accessory protein [Gammaproteobacteria bacterium]MDH5652351.1 iron-sulfur cluster assembly accessory protein [Gammaproteobacteria bacterium]